MGKYVRIRGSKRNPSPSTGKAAATPCSPSPSTLRCAPSSAASRVASAGEAGASADGTPSAGAWAEAECAICLSELAGGERVRVLQACGHGFHDACVNGWLAARAS